MANAAVAWVNLFDSLSASALGASSIALPIGNLLTEHVEQRWRSVGNSGYFVADFGGLVSADTLALLGTTMSAVGTIRWRLSTVDATGAAGDAYDSGAPAVVDDDYNAHVVALPAPVSFRYLRVDLSDASGSYVEAGRPFAGLRTALTYSFGYGWSETWFDRSKLTEADGGQTLVWRDNFYRVVDVKFEWVTADQRDSVVRACTIANRASTDVLFLMDPASTNLAKDSIWGLMKLAPITQNFFDLYQWQLTVTQRL